MSVLSYSNAPAPAPAVREPAPDRAPLSRTWLWFWAAAITIAYALLWSPHWYPLSDSSLFLSLGRSIADGRGMTVQGEHVTKIPPGAPLLIAAVFKLGGGIGALQAVMTALILAAHALAFLTLRRWVDPRLALAATVASAGSYWVFANAFTIMTEPPSLVFLWGGLLALTGVTVSADGRINWPRYGLALALLLLSAACRDALLALLPGFFVALFLVHRNAPWRAHAKWALLAVVVFGAWTVYRYPERFARMVGIETRQKRPAIAPAQRAPATGPATRLAPAAAPTPTPAATEPDPEPVDEPAPAGDVDDVDNDRPYAGPSREGKYKFQLMFGVPRDLASMLTLPPVLAGRWLAEGTVAGTSMFYDTNDAPRAWAGYAIGAVGFVVLVAGVGSLLARGHWWVIAPTLYFLSIWLQWGTRMKPRYMGLIAPMLVLVAAAGAAWLVRLLPAARRANRQKVARIVAYTIVALILIGNAYPWYVEASIRRQTTRDFYTVARRGAYAQLVDIGGYLQKHARPDETVWTNVGAHRRITHFLVGRPLRIHQAPCTVPGDWKNPRSKAMRRLRAKIPPTDRYLILYTEHPAKKLQWPTWHTPLTPQRRIPAWWRLFERTPDGWRLVRTTPNRDYVRSIPKTASY